MDTFISPSPEATRAWGAAWSRTATPGWVLGLSGDLGAGKTELVKGLALGLGFTGRVHSPTFTLINEYHGGRLPLAHLDLYRFEHIDQIHAAGLDEYLLAPLGITVVEWYERWETGFRPPARLRRVWIETLDETRRCLRHEDSCP